MSKVHVNLNEYLATLNPSNAERKSQLISLHTPEYCIMQVSANIGIILEYLTCRDYREHAQGPWVLTESYIWRSCTVIMIIAAEMPCADL